MNHFFGCLFRLRRANVRKHLRDTPQKLNETLGHVQVQLAIHRGRIDDRVLPGNVHGMSSQKRVVGWNLSNAEFFNESQILFCTRKLPHILPMALNVSENMSCTDQGVCRT